MHEDFTSYMSPSITYVYMQHITSKWQISLKRFDVLSESIQVTPIQ